MESNAEPNFLSDESLSNVVYILEPVQDDLSDIRQILLDWNLSELEALFTEHNIDRQCLIDITTSDIDILIPKELLNLRIKFKAKLAAWRISEGHGSISVADTFSLNSSIQTEVSKWLDKRSVKSPSPVCASPSDTNIRRVENLDIQQIMTLYSKGKYLLLQTKENTPFTSSQRKDLISIIVDHCIEENISLGTEQCEYLASKIQERFPLESKESYFIRSAPTGRARGPLYSCYNNKLKYRRKQGILKGPSRKTEKRKTPPTSPTSPAEIIETDCTNTKNWLRFNLEPWEVVETKWTETYSSRRSDVRSKSLADIFKEWPILTQSRALRLIELDFIQQFGENSSLALRTKWVQFSEKVTDVAANEKQSIIRELVIQVQRETIDKDVKDCLIFEILHYLLPSAKKIKVKDTTVEKDRFWHTSVKDSLDSCIHKVSHQGDILIEYRKLGEKYQSLGMRLQPIIVQCESEFYIVVDNVIHKVDSFLSALDNLFKIFYVLNIEYPQQSINVWYFMQEYFYGIKLEKTSSNVNALLNSLKF